MSGASLAFSATQSGLSGLTSGGETIHLLISNPAGGIPTIIGYVGGDPAAAGSHVFEISLNLSTSTGEYIFTLLRPLDHPGANTEDTLNLVISYTASNASGTFGSTFGVNVNDDSPEIDPNGFDHPLTTGGSEGSEGGLLVSHADLKDPDGGTSVRGGTLGVLWGADHFNAHENGGISETNGHAGDRSLVFTDATVELSSGETTLTNNLFSHGEQVHFALDQNGTRLIAFTGEGEGEGDIVFTVDLTDTGNGGYIFTQYQELDHVGATGEQQQVNLDSLNLAFHYTATDSDGDAVTGSFKVTIEDDAPTINVEGIDNGQVVEDLLDHGNPGDTYTGVQGPESVSFTGNLGVSWGADNSNSGSANRSLAFNGITEGGAVTDHGGAPVTSHDQAVHYHLAMDGDQAVLIGYTGDAAAEDQSNWVFKITLDDSSDTGSYTFTLLQPIDHPTANSEDNVILDFGFTATDADGDTATGSFGVTVNDDAPAASGTVEARTVDEGDIATWMSTGSSPNDGTGDGSATGGPISSALSALFGVALGGPAYLSGTVATTVAFGADGAHAGGGFGFATDAATTMNALGLTSQGDALQFTVIGNTLIGYVNNLFNGYQLIFDRPVLALTLNSDGSYEFRQFDQLDHVSGGGQNFTLQTSGGPIEAIDFGALITATDGDGDSISLAGQFTIAIRDDVPVVTIAASGAVTIDETGGHQSGNDDNTALSSVRHLFDNVTNVGSDPDMTAVYARDHLVSTTADSGADDPRSTKALSLHIDTVDSGLTTTDGHHIYLYQVSDTLVVGRVDGETGAAAFAVTIDQSGNVSVAQYISLHHGDTTTANDAVDLTGKLSAVVTVTDYDGDTVSQSTDIGDNIQFRDDGPRLAGTVTSGLSLNENDLPAGNDSSKEPLTANGNLAIDLGADGGQIALSAEGASWNAATHTLTASDGAWTVTLNSNGTYTFTLLDNTLLHGPANNGTNALSVPVTYTATDGDGDILSGSFTVTIVDDAPVVTGDGQNNVALYESHIDAIGNDQPAGTAAALSSEVTGTIGKVSFGADGFGSMAFSGDFNVPNGGHGALSEGGVGQNSGLTSDGDAVWVRLSADGLTIEGYVPDRGDEVVFTAKLNGVDTGYTVNLVGNIDHQPPDGVPGGRDEGQSLNFSVVATDGDGDTANVTLSLRINDDAPTASWLGAQAVTERATADGAFIPATSTGTLVFDTGADGGKVTAIVYRFGTAIMEQSEGPSDPQSFPALTSNGAAVTIATVTNAAAFSGEGSITLTGTTTDGHTVFTLVVNQTTGAYTYTLLGPIDHPDLNQGDASDALTMVFDFQVTDGDGDTTAAFNQGILQIDIRDDVPTIVTPSIGANLVVNGQFTDNSGFGAPMSWGGQAAPANSDIEGWHIAGNNLERNPANWYVPDPANGGRVVDLDATPGNVTLSQTFGNLTDGESYTLTFDAAKPAGYDAQTEVYWNGQLVGTVTPNADHFEQFSITVTAGSGSNTLEFREVGAADNGGTFLANVAMHATNAIVNEDALGGNAGGQGDDPGTSASAIGSLGISWGADAGDSTDAGGVQDGTTANAISDNTAALTGRAVYFTDSDSVSSGLQPAVSAFAGAAAIALHAAGQEVHYQILENGTKLVGYTGAFDVADTTNWVFTVSLSDEGAGKYSFDLLKAIDHPMSGSEDDISLVFGFTARDADGDTVSSSLTITVDDDTPVIAAPAIASVTENGSVYEPANASFESDALTPGTPGVTTDQTGSYTYSAPDGWTISGGNGGVFAPANHITDASGHDGSNVVWLRSGATLAQTTGMTLQAGDIYGLHFNLGDRTDQGFPDGVVRLIATNGVDSFELAHLDLPTPADGEWTTVNLSTGQIAQAYDGYQLRIEIQQGDGTGNQILIDDVEVSHFVPSVAQDSLNISWGADNEASLRTVAFTGAPNADGLSSNGQPIHYEMSSDHTMLKGVSSDGRTIFTLELSSSDHGNYTFTLLGNLDHQGANETVLPLDFSYKATDADGDSTLGTIHIDVNDQGVSLAPVADASVDEVTVNSANSNAFIPQSIEDHTLGIQWGADNANPGASNIDRSVVLTTTAAPAELHSDGFALKYVLSDDGTTLTAYRVGMGTNPITNEAEEHYFTSSGGDLLGTLTDYAADHARVFSVTISDSGNGSYSFTLYGNLDHNGANDSTIPLNFGFTATDGDGDFHSSDFTINVQDSVPLPTVPANTTVAESGVETFAHTVSGAVGIDWNGDVGAAKHIEFIGTPAGLTSQGQNLAYAIVADGDNQMLIAYRVNETQDAPVFTVQFTEANPYYTFTLMQPLDHNPASDSLTIPFTVRATDSDGDSAEQTFNVTVDDSNPSATDVSASMFENDTINVDLTGHYDFGTDGSNATNPVTLGNAYISGAPIGVTLGLPSISLNPDGHTVTVNPGSSLDGLSEGQQVVLHIPFSVTDGDNDSVTKEILVTVTGTNDAPVLDLSGPDVPGNDTIATAVEQLPQWFMNKATITDVDSTTMASLTVTLATRPDGADETLSLNTAAQNALAAHSLASSYDPTTGALIITGVAAVAVYQTILDGVVYFNNSDNPATTDRTITVSVNDGISDSAQQSVTLHVWASNDAPQLDGSLQATVEEGGTHVIQVSELGFSDPDDVASGVTFIVSDQHNGIVKLDGVPSLSFTGEQLANGHVTFVHDGSETTAASFVVKVEDGNEDNSAPVPQTFHLDVTPVNDAPMITSNGGGDTAAIQIQENQTAVTTVVATDPDGPTLTYAITGGADHDLFQIDSTTGALSFINAPDYEHPHDVGGDNHYNVIVTASDGSLSDSQALDIEVTDVTETLSPITVTNDNPYYAFSDNLHAPHGQPVTINFNANDIFGGGSDTFSYTFTKVYSSPGTNWLTADEAHGTITGDPGHLSSALTVYRIDAVDAVTHQSTFTYVAFSALPDDGRYISITDQSSYGQPYHSDVIEVSSGSTASGTISGGSGSDVLIGNDHDNQLTGNSEFDALYGKGGNDDLQASSSTGFLSGGDGDDNLDAGSDHGYLLGGAGNDYLRGSGNDDVLMGGDGNDTILGMQGRDLIVGGAGNDTLTGGSGQDTYVFFESGDANADIITDFDTTSSNVDKDVLDLSYLLDSIGSDKESHVRFVYSDPGHSTHVLSDVSAPPAINGDVTVQVNTSGSWENVVTLSDTGANLTTGSNVIQMMLDHSTVQQFHA
ncbi:MAG: T1SS-143 repeat domain-containing protein [Afipia sp.]